MARGGHEAVVFVRSYEIRLGPEPLNEGGNVPHRCFAGPGSRDNAVHLAREQSSLRRLRASRLLAGHRMAPHEIHVLRQQVRRPVKNHSLGTANIGDYGPFLQPLAHHLHDALHRHDRRCQHHNICILYGVEEPGLDLVEGPHLLGRRTCTVFRVRPDQRQFFQVRLPQCQAHRSPDEAGPNDRYLRHCFLPGAGFPNPAAAGLDGAQLAQSYTKPPGIRNRTPHAPLGTPA